MVPEMLAGCGYLSQIASMADASEVVTDGPMLALSESGRAIWIPLDANNRRYAFGVVAGSPGVQL